MKRNRHSLYLTGILLTCSLALTACHLTSQTNQSQDSKSYQKTTKTKKPRHKKLPKQGIRKDISGIDKPTDDGFLLTDESQIESKTDTGIIVKHGDHKHFFFYSDLKG
ncbi:pneumococcal-type histidine triad protein, partial [Streptococcus canis]